VERVIFAGDDGEAAVCRQFGQGCFNRAPMRIGVAIKANRRGARFASDLIEDGKLIPGASDEPAALFLEITIQRIQATGEECLAREAAPTMPAAPFARDVKGDYFVVTCDGAIERGVIGEAEIAAKPMDGSAHQYASNYARRC
jgi:hypothetical protein